MSTDTPKEHYMIRIRNAIRRGHGVTLSHDELWNLVMMDTAIKDRIDNFLFEETSVRCGLSSNFTRRDYD